ncbi:L,D-transpeptidase family protein [Yoonia sp. MH D7]
MISRRLMMFGAALGAAGCSTSKFQSYSGTKADRIQIFKERGVMQLVGGTSVMKSYGFQLGFSPVGHKQVEGDGRTPEGVYRMNRRNPNSRFHLSLGISYPNERDRAYARSIGKSPGGDIFIHGTPEAYVGEPNWTWGCVAVSNPEIEEIYAMVADNALVLIAP